MNTVPVDLHSAFRLKCLHAMVSAFYIAAVNKLEVPFVFLSFVSLSALLSLGVFLQLGI